MSETRKLAAILVSDVVGYSRFAGGADWGACLQPLLARALLVLKRAVPMRGEDDLVARVRACLAGVEGVSEMKMFGGVGFMLNGNMLAGTSKRGLLLRVGKERHAAAVAEPGMRAMEQRGRVMEGYVYADPPPALDASLKAWLERALDHVRTLPPKPAKTRGKPTRAGRVR
jgi:TfoX/Sxy family transcriptional regulator of competence genes